MMQRGFSPIIILVGALVMVVVAGAAYYFGRSQSVKPEDTSASNPTVISQSPQTNATSQTVSTPSSTTIDETANWETYTDSKYNYNLKFPPRSSGLANFTCEKGKTYGTLKYDGPDKFGLTESDKVEAACWPGELLKNTIEVVVSTGKLPKKADFKNYPETKMETNSVTLDGVKGIEVTFTKVSSAPYPQKWSQVFVGNGGRLYTLTFASSYASVNSAYEEIFNQILSTFKFTQ